MNANVDPRDVADHERVFDDFLQFYLNDFPFTLRVDTMNFGGTLCQLTLTSSVDVIDIFEANQILDMLFENAFRNFSEQQFFTDIDGNDFGSATVWHQPEMTIRGDETSYAIQCLIALEPLEPGHEFSNRIFIMI